MFVFWRLAQLALPFLATAGLHAPAAQAQQTPAQQAPTARESPWLYEGSDIVQDPDWKFGKLANGLRYAVRKNGVPPGQVAIRVRIDAGSLMERDDERGFAHLIEHLSFRGSKHVPDGESKRIWQRLGVTFGSDSNASTTFTETVYKLDLPSADEAGLRESFKILAGMMDAPAITAAALTAERPVVLAEQREQPGPQVRMQEAMLKLMFAGQPLSERNPIGTVQTLTGATPESLQAFHARWYRPDRAVVIAVGDVDPGLLERLIGEYFAGWQGQGPAPAGPDFGKPAPGGQLAATIVEPAVPPIVTAATIRPWTVFSDTVIFNQKRMVDLVALRILNRRLESRARAGASFLAAGADLDDYSRSANVTTLTILPLGSDWEKALREVRAIVADAMAAAPTQAEIDREIAEIDAAMKNGIATDPVTAGAKLADDLVHAIDINETMTTAQASYDMFRAAVDGGMFTPATVLESSRRVFEGVETRALVNLHTPDSQAVAKLAAALAADVGAARRRTGVASLSFDRLPQLGRPSKIVSRETVLADPKVEKIRFANGVTLLLHQNSSEVSRVYVNVRFGGGRNALPANRKTALWAGEQALAASGLAGFGQEEIDALTGQRQIGFDFSVADDAFAFAGQTTGADLGDQLRLFATKLAFPGWDPNPVARAKAAMLAGYAGLSASPDAVLSRDLDALLHSGDPRWGTPSRAEIEAMTPASFKATWAPILASGPIEVSVFGDVDSEAAIAAVARSFGAMAPRRPAPAAAPAAAFPPHTGRPVVLRHKGQADQAAAVIAWPTGGGSAGITESRKLEILAAVFRDRMIEQLRSQAGVSYSPNVASDWPLGMPRGGKLIALGLLPPDKTDFFFTLARGIAADLVAKPVSADELSRSLTPLAQYLMRIATGNLFWQRLVSGGSTDPERIAAVDRLARDYTATTPAELQALAAKYLRPEADWTVVVLPQEGAVAAR